MARKTPSIIVKTFLPAQGILCWLTTGRATRELLNALHRVALWSEGATITEEELREALLLFPASEDDSVRNGP
jgi:hypothetical protein